MASLRGAVSTLRVLGLRLTMMEALRRIINKTYEIDGVAINNSTTFRIIRMIRARGWSVVRDGEWYLLKANFGIVASRDLWLFREVAVQPDYGPVRGRVLDVGAYLGETAVKFARNGADYVVAYEPVYSDACAKTLELNGVRGECRPHGVWWREGELSIGGFGAGAGGVLGNFKIRVVALGDVLREGFDVAKLDCEGCEYAILTLPCEIISSVPRWIVEIHGPETPIVYKFVECGFKPLKKADLAQYVSIYEFVKEQKP